MGTGALARPSRAKLGSCRQPQQLWIRHAACCFAALFLLTAVSFADVLKITVDDAIQPVTAEYIGRALGLAAANHDQAVLIEINTPGGLVDSTREIIEKIVASPVPVIIYVTPSGAAPPRRDSSSSNPPTSRPWRPEPIPAPPIP